MYKLPNSISEDRLTAKNKYGFKSKQPILTKILYTLSVNKIKLFSIINYILSQP